MACLLVARIIHLMPSCGPYYPNCGRFKEAFWDPALSRLPATTTASLQVCKVILVNKFIYSVVENKRRNKLCVTVLFENSEKKCSKV